MAGEHRLWVTFPIARLEGLEKLCSELRSMGIDAKNGLANRWHIAVRPELAAAFATDPSSRESNPRRCSPAVNSTQACEPSLRGLTTTTLRIMALTDPPLSQAVEGLQVLSYEPGRQSSRCRRDGLCRFVVAFGRL